MSTFVNDMRLISAGNEPGDCMYAFGGCREGYLFFKEKGTLARKGRENGKKRERKHQTESCRAVYYGRIVEGAATDDDAAGT